MLNNNQTNATYGSLIPRLFRKVKAAWYDLPVWKRWLLGTSIVLSALAGIGLLLTSFVFTGGISAMIIGGIAAGLSIAAGITGAIFNGHSAYEFFKQGKIVKGIFALIGCLASILGSLGSIFQVANAVNSAALVGIGAGSAGGTVLSGSGGIVAGYIENDNEIELKDFSKIGESSPGHLQSQNHSPVSMMKKLDIDARIKAESVPAETIDNRVSYTKLFEKHHDSNEKVSNRQISLSPSSNI